MKINDIKPPKGSKTSKKRVGRGESSGLGRQSGRGNKGAQSRTGAKKRAWVEGGQMPLQRRLPKKGFASRNRIDYIPINIWQVSHFPAGTEINSELLKEKGIINKKLPIKLLANGELKVPLNFKVNKASKNAIQKIEKAGGRVEVLP